LIDDPIRSREDADSEHVRNKIWEWYKSDLLTRLAPGGCGRRSRYPHRRSSNANSLCSQNSAGFPQICATFQRDNLRRRLCVRVSHAQPGSPGSLYAEYATALEVGDFCHVTLERSA
jgi:hypothetical protein